MGDRSNIIVDGSDELDVYSGLISGAVVTWNTATGLNKTLTRGGDFTLDLINLLNGMSGDLRLNITDTTTITLPTSELNGSVESLPIGIYHLAFVYDGTDLDFNIMLYEYVGPTTTTTTTAPTTTTTTTTAAPIGGTPWELTNVNYSYNNVFYDPSAQVEQPYEIRVSVDGTKLYLLNVFDTNIYQYALSTAWDLSTISYAKSYDFGVGTGYITAIDFNSSGTMLFVGKRGGSSTKNLYKYTLSTPWDIATISYDSISTAITIDFAESLVISSDGTKAYFYVGNISRVYEFSMSTPYDVTTLSSTGNYVSNSTSTGLFFKPDGTRMYVGYNQYILSTPWDLSTATNSNNNYTEGLGRSDGMHFKQDDGTKFFTSSIVSGNRFIYEYIFDNY